MPAAHRIYSAVGLALTGFSGQASFSHLSMYPNAYYVSSTYFLQKHLLLPVWANYFLKISAQAFSPLPSTHPLYPSFTFLLKAMAAPSAFTFMCFHPSILFLTRLSIYNCKNHQSCLYDCSLSPCLVYSQCSKYIYHRSLTLWFTSDYNSLFLKDCNLPGKIMIAFSNLHLSLVHISLTKLRGLQKFYSFCIIFRTTIIENLVPSLLFLSSLNTSVSFYCYSNLLY